MASFSDIVKRAAGPVVLAALVIAGIYFQATKVKLDDTGCPINRAPGRLTFLVVDQSDPFERADREMVADVVDGWKAGSKPGDRIEIVVPDVDMPFEPRIPFEACAPANPHTANPLFSTTSRLEEPWRAFEQKIDAAVGAVMTSRTAKRSPLAETMVALSREPEFRAAKQREVILISDLMQNSRSANFYRQVPTDMERFARNGDMGKVDLKNTEVNVRYAARRSQWRKREAVRAFWREWVEWQGGRFTVETE